MHKRPNYRQWDHFSWADYLERAKLTRTFNVRHLPLSDGTDDNFFENFLEDPPEWNQPQRKRRKTKHEKRVEVRKADGATPSDTIMVLDVETGELVPLEK